MIFKVRMLKFWMLIWLLYLKPMGPALYLIFKMYFDTSGMKESNLTENEWKHWGWGGGLAWFASAQITVF